MASVKQPNMSFEAAEFTWPYRTAEVRAVYLPASHFGRLFIVPPGWPPIT